MKTKIIEKFREMNLKIKNRESFLKKHYIQKGIFKYNNQVFFFNTL